MLLGVCQKHREPAPPVQVVPQEPWARHGRHVQTKLAHEKRPSPGTGLAQHLQFSAWRCYFFPCCLFLSRLVSHNTNPKAAGVGWDLKDYPVPTLCRGQGHLPLAWVAPSPVQPGFWNFHTASPGNITWSRQEERNRPLYAEILGQN